MPVMDHLSALTALEEGQIDAFTGDTSTLIQFTKEYPELIVVGERFTQEPYGIGLPQGDDRFRNLVNFTLQEMERDGTYDAMYCQWFPDEYAPYNIETWPDIATTDTYEGINIKRVGPPLENNCEIEDNSSTLPIIVVDAELYTVNLGDTLGGIAERFYGDIFSWTTIYEDNRDIIGDDPTLLEEGMQLRLRRELIDSN